ncbi:MAG: sensor histidine kinase [Culicoidibacterales bacterium]
MRTNKISLQWLLMFVFILFSVIIIGTVTFTTNVVLKREFITYVDKLHVEDLSAIAEQAEKYLNGAESKADFVVYTDLLVKQGFILKIAEDGLIFDGFSENAEALSRLKAQYNLKEEQVLRYFDSLYSTYEVTVTQKGETKSVVIYNYRPFFINEDGFRHLNSLNESFLFIGGITFSFAIFLSIILSKSFIKPLNALILKLKAIEQGKHAEEIRVNSRIIEYQELVAAFNHLNNSLKKQKEIRKNLSIDLSHEIRTPLTSIGLTLENINYGIWNYDTKTSKSLIEEVERIQLLIEDIHQLEQVESQVYDLVLERINIVAIFEQTLAVFRGEIQEKQLRITKKYSTEWLFADKKRIAQVIINIISNAIKYSQQNGEIIIEVKTANGEDVISIKDTGIGISKGEQSKIFDRYYRSSSSKKINTQGLGVGLSIVKKIIDAHDGEIMLFSDRDKGTEIIITLKKK